MNFLDDLSYPNLYKSNLCWVGRLPEMGTLYSIFHLTRQSKEGSGFKTKQKQNKKRRKEKQKEELKYFFSQSWKIPILKTPATWYILKNICG